MNTLEILLVHDNPLTEFPADLGKAKNLKILDLSETKIKEIPEFISELQYLEELKFPLQIVGFPQSQDIVEIFNLTRLYGSNTFVIIPSATGGAQFDLFDDGWLSDYSYWRRNY